MSDQTPRPEQKLEPQEPALKKASASRTPSAELEETSSLPSPWQKQILWQAITALAVAVLLSLAVLLIWVLQKVLVFLQPVLIPLAVAGVLAFLLEPLASFLRRRGWKPMVAIATVLGGFGLLILGLLGAVVPIVYLQGQKFVKDWPDNYADTRYFFNEQLLPRVESWGIDLGFETSESNQTEAEQAAGQGSEASQAEGQDVVVAADTGQDSNSDADSAVSVGQAEGDATGATEQQELASTAGSSLSEQVLREAGKTPFDQFIASLFSEENLNRVVTWTRTRLSGFFGVLGYVVGLILVPVYLFFFLRESKWIKRHWARLLPLRAGHLRDEIADVLEEINGYLIAFFRGQLAVSFLDGLFTAILLWAVGLDYALVIGFVLAIVGIIPFIGIVITMVPAILVAFATAGNHDWQWVQDAPWAYALLVAGIFMAVQQFDGLVIQPKIVGNATGLHPMTVIFSVVFWGFLLGGLFGAILAVPLTASIKVLLRRYVWEGNWGTRLRERMKHPAEPA